MSKKLILMMALSLCMGAAQARGTVPLADPPHSLLLGADGKALDTAQVRAAIVNGAAKANWRVREDQPGKMTLMFSKNSGKHEVVVDVTYDSTGFDIHYQSSVGMKYVQSGSGAEIHPYYNTWVQKLSRDIEAAAHR